jgi:Nif-specific regulatory protein
MEEISGEIRNLSTLLEVSQALSGIHNLKSALHRVLEILEQNHGMVRTAITLLNEETGELAIEAASGVGPAAWKVRYKIGEGITGRVVESGKHIVVPMISREPLFLHRAAPRRSANQERSFICVPILSGRKPAGALSVDLVFKKERNYDRSVKFLRIVASMIAQALKMQRLIRSEREQLIKENSLLREELRGRQGFVQLVGHSSPMRSVHEQILQVSPTNTTVLIRGESGTGKELVAREVHYSSPRSRRPFVKVSCAALPDTLIESELFGYEKGAFTGATERKKGRFELAEGGTLFLDEIGDINLATQVKLLRVLQEREIERLGSTDSVKVNVRLVAATNKNLEKAMQNGEFREDLYYRLNVFSICLPPLRERKPDIMPMVDHFLEKFAVEHGKIIKRISTPAIDMLVSYHWPGNVRELENTIERAVLVCDGSVIHAHHLPPTLQTAEASGTLNRQSLTESVAAYEKSLIQDALKSSLGNRAKAARLLGSTERIFNYKVKKYQLDCSRFRE